MTTGATLFTGFDGAGIGMAAAGIDLRWGIELEDKIAAVARMNRHNVITANILDVDPRSMERVDCLHASPPCTRASNANSSAETNEDGLKETQTDIDLAMKAVQFIEVLQPRVVTIENVWGYRKFQAYKGGKKCEGILPALERMGYWVDVQHVNAADFGVPQTRKRLILRAVKGAWLPLLPEPEPWVGWYAAIEDLIPTLPASEFAPWQLARLPEEIKTWMVGNDRNGDARDRLNLSAETDPAFTVTSSNGTKLKAFLVSPVDGLIRDGYEPSQTVVCSPKTVEPRAFLVNTREMHGNEGAPYTSVPEDKPIYTIPSSSGASRHKAWLSTGRVVKMTPCALARFQSIPDTYTLSGNNALDCKGIGNAVPPLMMEKLYRQLRQP
jgi:DNA-cytosine methyltransferase